MNLQDVFDQLSGGEFSQLAIGGVPRGGINDTNYKVVVAHINLGLTALYRRFDLKSTRLTLVLQPGQEIYKLQARYAVTNGASPEPVKYILDAADRKFVDDSVFKITRVTTDQKVDVPLNQFDNEYSVMTPSLTSLAVPDVLANQGSATPDWLKTQYLYVHYRTNHPTILVPVGAFDPKSVELELPTSHLEALLYFVASRVNNPIGMTNEFHAGNNYAQKYEAACLELLNLGLETDEGHTIKRFGRKGFV